MPDPADMKPGIYNMPFPTYKAIRAVNASSLKVAASRSWAAYRYDQDHPTDGHTASRGALRAYHCMTLEGAEEFDRQFWVHDLHRASKEYKTIAPGMVALGKTDIKTAERDTAIALSAKLHADPKTARYLTGDGHSEVTLVWVDPETGIPCKARLDRLVPGVVVDLKNVGSTDERLVRSQCLKLHWHLQAAHYVTGAKVLLGRDHGFRLIGFEDRDHYESAVFSLTPDGLLGVGERLRFDLMRELAEHRENNTWPERHEDEVELEAPDYLLPEMEVGDDTPDTEDHTDVPY